MTLRSLSETGSLQRDVGAPTPLLPHTSSPQTSKPLLSQGMPREADVPEGTLSSLLCIPALTDLLSFLMFGNIMLPATTLRNDYYDMIQQNQTSGAAVYACPAAHVNIKAEESEKEHDYVPYISLSFNSLASLDIKFM